jgi:hypothetical protein
MKQARWDGTGHKTNVRRRGGGGAGAGGGAARARAAADDGGGSWTAYESRHSQQLTEAYVHHRLAVELPGVETTIDFTTMSHTVNGVDQQFEVRGRMNAASEPLPALAPLAPLAVETFEGRAVRAGTMQRYMLRPRRAFAGEEDEEERHFRIAEAQFLRMGGQHTVQAVEYAAPLPCLALPCLALP